MPEPRLGSGTHGTGNLPQDGSDVPRRRQPDRSTDRGGLRRNQPAAASITIPVDRSAALEGVDGGARQPLRDRRVLPWMERRESGAHLLQHAEDGRPQGGKSMRLNEDLVNLFKYIGFDVPAPVAWILAGLVILIIGILFKLAFKG